MTETSRPLRSMSECNTSTCSKMLFENIEQELSGSCGDLFVQGRVLKVQLQCRIFGVKSKVWKDCKVYIFNDVTIIGTHRRGLFGGLSEGFKEKYRFNTKELHVELYNQEEDPSGRRFVLKSKNDELSMPDDGLAFECNSKQDTFSIRDSINLISNTTGRRAWTMKLKKTNRNSHNLEKLAANYIPITLPKALEICGSSLVELNDFYFLQKDNAINPLFVSLHKTFKLEGMLTNDEGMYRWIIVNINNNIIYYELKCKTLPTINDWICKLKDNNNNNILSPISSSSSTTSSSTITSSLSPLPPPLPPPSNSNNNITIDEDIIKLASQSMPHIIVLQGLVPEIYGEYKNEESKHRFNLYKELYETEKSYLDDLKLIHVFYVQFQIEKVISDEEINILFGNYHEILLIHDKILKELENHLPAERCSSFMPNIFMNSLKESLKQYLLYCENYNKSFPLYTELLDNNNNFTDFVQLCSKHPLARGLRLDSYLIKPVQRICKYHLIFRDILKHTEEDHVNRKSLEDVYGVMINGEMKSHEESAALFELAQKIYGVEDLVVPHRYIIVQCPVNITINKNNQQQITYGIFFNDMMLLAKEHSGIFTNNGYKVIIRLDYNNICSDTINKMNSVTNSKEIKINYFTSNDKSSHDEYCIIFDDKDNRDSMYNYLITNLSDIQCKRQETCVSGKYAELTWNGVAEGLTKDKFEQFKLSPTKQRMIVES